MSFSDKLEAQKITSENIQNYMYIPTPEEFTEYLKTIPIKALIMWAKAKTTDHWGPIEEELERRATSLPSSPPPQESWKKA